MNLLTNILHWISTGLLIPVIVFLLIAFVAALLMLGGFYGLYMHRLRFKKRLEELFTLLNLHSVRQVDFSDVLKERGLFSEHLRMMIADNWRPLHSEKIIANAELKYDKELSAARTLMRVGPMLGLMGTLIPMGPALVGLAAGDIAAMAINMQVAFSTTVVGIFVGVIGYMTQLLKQRWFSEDINNLQYLYELAQTEVSNNETAKILSPKIHG